MHATYQYKVASRSLREFEYVDAIKWCMENCVYTSAIWKSAGSQRLVRVGRVWTRSLLKASNYRAAEEMRLMDGKKLFSYPRAFFFRDAGDAALFRLKYS